MFVPSKYAATLGVLGFATTPDAIRKVQFEFMSSKTVTAASALFDPVLKLP
jgi:hypothetical protein